MQTSTSFRVVGNQALFNFPPGIIPSNVAGWWDVAQDNQRFLMSRSKQFGGDNGGGTTPELVLVQNFFEELKARVPN